MFQLSFTVQMWQNRYQYGFLGIYIRTMLSANKEKLHCVGYKMSANVIYVPHTFVSTKNINCSYKETIHKLNHIRDQ